MRRTLSALLLVLAAVGMLVILFWPRLSIRESGHGFVCGDYLVLGEYGYSDGGDRLRFAIFRTWSKDSTPAQRSLDTRRGRGFLAWPLIRGNDGRMTPVEADGNLYFFEGETLKTMKVRMNEHTDTIPLDNLKTLEEVWAYLQQFRVNNSE